MTELLRVEDLRAGYGAGDVLRGVSFTLRCGEVCALLGENGCGKTTLLRAACALLPYRGSCALAGREMRALTARERARRVGWLGQRDGAELPLRGLDAVLMGFNPLLGALQSPTAAQRARAMALLDELGAAEFAERDWTELSAGQRQMLRFARALVREDVDLLALDEPEAALDLTRRREMFARLRARAARGCSVLLSAHDVNATLRWADRLLMMKGGAICAAVDLRAAGCAEVEAALRAAFGPVEVFAHGGRLLMAEVEA